MITIITDWERIDSGGHNHTRTDCYRNCGPVQRKDSYEESLRSVQVPDLLCFDAFRIVIADRIGHDDEDRDDG